ncbi:MAG TPA: enoyl-CoA hydratase-related protein [Fodinibius sp.]|nr:enoyl-CoA hydratase-related protein [Fodinibius sp.]
MSVLKVEYKNSICQAVINRPKTHNAINFDLMEAFEQLLDKLESDNQTRCLILSGSGPSFISGGDLQEFHNLKTAEKARPMAKRMLSILTRIEKLPCWAIAAVNGPAYGGGCEIILAFDFRIASPEATFGFTQGKFYLPPGWGGLTRLIESVGRSTALRWLAEARIINARTALSTNLIDRIADSGNLQDESIKWAGQLTHNNRAFIKNLKDGAMRLTRARWQAIDAELDTFVQFWENEEHHSRVQQFLERKKER